MKRINYYSTILSLAVVCFFTSCSTTKYGAHFQPSNNAATDYTKAEKADEPALALEEEGTTEELKEAAERSGANSVSADALPEAESLKKVITEVKAIDESEFTERQQQILKETRERINNMTRKEKRQLRKEIRKINLAEYTKDLPSYDKLDAMQDRRGGAVNLVALIFAIFIPPLGVFIDQGVNSKFWVSLILTILGLTSFLFIPALGLLPAVIYSVLVVLRVI